jgi:DNA-directed RNA polymerase II subunit RPB7
MGFFADVGPLSVFVSQQVRLVPLAYVLDLTRFGQLIHPDMRFDPNSNPPSFASEDQVRVMNRRLA